jgi:hypothetical protein
MDHEKWLEQHDQMMADHDLRFARTEKVLRTAIRLAVQDARRQRRRNAEFDKRHLEAQEEMKELRRLMQMFLEGGGNGKH